MFVPSLGGAHYGPAGVEAATLPAVFAPVHLKMVPVHLEMVPACLELVPDRLEMVPAHLKIVLFPSGDSSFPSGNGSCPVALLCLLAQDGSWNLGQREEQAWRLMDCFSLRALSKQS